VHVRMTGAAGKVRLVAMDVLKTKSIVVLHQGIGRYRISQPSHAVEIHVRVRMRNGPARGIVVAVHCARVGVACSAIGSLVFRNGIALLRMRDTPQGINEIVIAIPPMDAIASIELTTIGTRQQPLEPWHQRAERESWNVNASGSATAVALEVAEDPSAMITTFLPIISTF